MREPKGTWPPDRKDSRIEKDSPVPYPRSRFPRDEIVAGCHDRPSLSGQGSPGKMGRRESFPRPRSAWSGCPQQRPRSALRRIPIRCCPGRLVLLSSAYLASGHDRSQVFQGLRDRPCLAEPVLSQRQEGQVSWRAVTVELVRPREGLQGLFILPHAVLRDPQGIEEASIIRAALAGGAGGFGQREGIAISRWIKTRLDDDLPARVVQVRSALRMAPASSRTKGRIFGSIARSARMASSTRERSKRWSKRESTVGVYLS